MRKSRFFLLVIVLVVLIVGQGLGTVPAQQPVTLVRGQEAGNAGDENPFTFMFAKDNNLVALKRLDGTPIKLEDVERLYGSEDGMQVYVDGEEVAAKYNLSARGVDLSDTAGWPNVKVSAGILSIDPSLGRFILRLPLFLELKRVGNYRVRGEGSDVYVLGQYAYITDYNYGLAILDISNPQKPKLVGKFEMDWGSEGVSVVSHYAYVAASDKKGLVIIDVAKPQEPKLVKIIDIPGTPHTVKIADSYAYVVALDEGIYIFDIADPENPQKIGSFDTPGLTKDIEVIGKYAYVADDAAGIEIFDISNPSQATLVSTFKTTVNAKRVKVAGNYLYIGANAGDDKGYLEVFDIANLTQPKAVSSLKTYRAYDIQLVGTYLFLADWTAGVKVFDVSNPSQPQQVGWLRTPGGALSMHAVEDHLYVMNSGRSIGLDILRMVFDFKPVQGSVQVDYNY